MLKSRGCSVVNLFHREVPRVLNLFPWELIEGTPKDLRRQTWGKPHQRPDQRPMVWPKMQQMVCLTKILRGAFYQLPWEQIENSRDFHREQIHHTTYKVFQQIVILTKYLTFMIWSSINSLGNRLRTQGTSIGFSLANQLENGQFPWQILIPNNTVKILLELF